MSFKFNEQLLRQQGFSQNSDGTWSKGGLPMITGKSESIKPPHPLDHFPQVKAPAAPVTAKERMQALGRMAAGKMNKTEAAYSEWLKRDENVVWWGFEKMTLKLADDTRYTPDFMVMMADGSIEFHEVKGYWTDDAKVKSKVAAAQFPMFRFKIVRKCPAKKGGGFYIDPVKQ